MNRAIIHILISVVCFAVVNVCVKYLQKLDYPSHELVLLRSLISFSFCVAIIKQLKIPFFGINKKWLILRGLFGTVALLLFFITLENMPLAVATAVQYLSPIFTIIIAIFLNNQKVKPIQWIFFLISFSGIVLMKYADIIKSTDFHEMWPLGLGLLSALLSGLAYNSIIKCKSTDNPITIVMYFPLMAIPLMGVLCVLDYENLRIPVGSEWLLILAIGVFTQIAQVFMTKALTSERAAIVTPFKYTGSIFAVSFGMIFFGEYLSIKTLLGILVVIAGVLINTAFEHRQRVSSLK